MNFKEELIEKYSMNSFSDNINEAIKIAIEESFKNQTGRKLEVELDGEVLSEIYESCSRCEFNLTLEKFVNELGFKFLKSDYNPNYCSSSVSIEFVILQ